MALSDIHWGKALRALQLRAVETSTPTNDVRSMLLLLKEHWDMLSDEAALDDYILSRTLVDLAAARDQLQIDLDSVIAEIEALENPAKI